MARNISWKVLCCLVILCGALVSPGCCQGESGNATDPTTASLVYNLFRNLFDIIDGFKKKELEGPVVVFHASRASNTETTGTPAKVAFDHVITNAGNGYNGTDGVFTAPVDGFYSFTTSLTSFHDSRLFLMLNGESVQYVVSVGPWESDTRTINLELKAGDQVWVEVIGTAFGEACGFTTSIGPAYKCYHSTFSGSLIGRK